MPENGRKMGACAPLRARSIKALPAVGVAEWAIAIAASSCGFHSYAWLCGSKPAGVGPSRQLENTKHHGDCGSKMLGDTEGSPLPRLRCRPWPWMLWCVWVSG